MEKRAEQTKNRRLVDDSENRFFFADFLLQKREKYLEHEIILILTFSPFHPRIFLLSRSVYLHIQIYHRRAALR